MKKLPLAAALFFIFALPAFAQSEYSKTSYSVDNFDLSAVRIELPAPPPARKLRRGREAFIVPLAELMDELRAGEDGGSWYLRFCVQAAYTVHPDVVTPAPDDLGRTPWTTGLKVLNDRAVALAEGALPPWVARRRWAHFARFATHALAERELRLDSDPVHKPDATDLYVADLADAGAAMLTAPSRPSTLALADS